MSERVPYEILEKIFLCLDSEDLWSCLRVSKKWREVANTNRLWKKHCSRIGHDEIPLDWITVGITELCTWAASYQIYYILPYRNWRLRNYKSFYFAMKYQTFIELWEGNRGVVYYYNNGCIQVYEAGIKGVQCSELSFHNVLLPPVGFTMSVALNKKYVAVSNCNIVLVCKRNTFSSMDPYKVFCSKEDNLKTLQYDKASIKENLCLDSSLLVKVILNDSLWLSNDYGDKIFIVNLLNGGIRTVLLHSYFLYTISSPFVATWDDYITLYDGLGDTIFKADIKCWNLCFNSSIIVIGNMETQSVETWDIKSGLKLISKNVLYHTDMVVHPKKDIIVISEKSKVVNRFTCIDAKEGTILWRIHPPAHERCHQFKIVAEYLFICNSYLLRPKFSLLNLSNAQFMYDGLLPGNLKHISTTLCVFSGDKQLQFMSYLQPRLN